MEKFYKVYFLILQKNPEANSRQLLFNSFHVLEIKTNISSSQVWQLLSSRNLTDTPQIAKPATETWK